MNAVRFPKMFNSNKTAIVKDKEATEQNLKALLASFKKTLLGDPYFGSNLQKLLFEHNNIILQDLVADDIYSTITAYMPQIRVVRNNITVESTGSTVNVHIRAQNLLDYTFNEYTLNLLTVEEL